MAVAAVLLPAGLAVLVLLSVHEAYHRYYSKLFLSIYCTSLLILLAESISDSECATSRGQKQR